MVIWFIEIKSFDAEVLNLCWWRTLCSYKLTNESILCFIKVFCVSQLLETFFFFPICCGTQTHRVKKTRVTWVTLIIS